VRHAVSGGKPVAFGNFWRKRFARIWPAYLAALGGAMVIGVGQIDGPSGWAKHLLLIQTWFVDRGGSGLRVSWTLVVEVAFYAAVVPLGALVALARGRSHDAWIALCLASFAAGAVAMVFVSYGPTAVAFRVLPPYLLSFAVGMLLAGAEVDRSTATWSKPVITAVRKLAARPAVCFGLALGLFAGLAAVVPGDPIAPAVDSGLERTVQSFVQVAVSFLALAPLALRSTEARWLEHRALTALGAASFGFYLWHIQILRMLRPMLGGSTLTAWAAVAIAIAGAYLAGEASRRWVEEPARKLLTR
jgi:peptidoglycan/LPS O-acetylase OafA/YrhL